MPAAQVPSFVCQRPDWGCVASAYLCIWKEVAYRTPNAKDIVTRCTTLPPSASPYRQSPLIEAARSILRRRGIAMHPSVLMRDIQSRDVRASTPGSSGTAQSHEPVPAAKPRTRGKTPAAAKPRTKGTSGNSNKRARLLDSLRSETNMQRHVAGTRARSLYDVKCSR